MEQKTKALYIFTDKFQNLTEQEKNIFSKIVNKLFQINYLTIQKTEDANDYRFILLYKELFTSFFKLSDFQLEIKKYDEVIFIKNLNHFNKLKLKKEESLILLILRILFQQKRENKSSGTISIYLQDIYHKLNSIDYKEIKKLTKEKIKNILALYKRFNIINYIENELSDDLIITIYNSILYLIDLDMIKQYTESLNLKYDDKN
ncbi:DUF4194 domain-containing protein [Columbia Basin potato purple top phytoplasma]|uniref:DUF4194 domain-containing protein n=1 Tax=Columbia Basin potato purple top phytoplasma TaxID=307134 RepID=A0ABT5L948_9MOLU|nr:DUF4194 domain-containing protein [Columbia Basin potato purple top phytoplasma]MDC9032120.1 DUF4194 domain-containing protein [Columbia Basin potato purple top phytoplasma]